MPHEPGAAEPDDAELRVGTPQGRWVLAATVLGSGIAFLDGTVVQVALPAIGDDLGGSLADLQWTINGYLVTLSALLLLGGSLGDRFGRRRVFVAGLVAFTVASVLCGLAPSPGLLIAARALQGVGGAMLVPGSLSIVASSFHAEDRAKAIGAWSGLAGVAGAVGPFVGGWLIDSVSWRWVFLINLPLAAVAIWITVRHVPETRSATATHLDVPGAALATITLAGITYFAIDRGGGLSVASGVGGLAAGIAFVVVERRSPQPMLPVSLFASRQFSGANLATVAVYAGLGGAFFLLVLRLQFSLGYSALEAGAALVPFTLLLLVLSARAGELAQRIGARGPMTLGPLAAAVGIVLLSGVSPGDRYVSGVLPGVVVFGLGMALTVAPLTAAVFASVPDESAGAASGVNNAAARMAGLLAVAALPSLAGVTTDGPVADSLDAGFAAGMRIAAAVTATGGLISFLLVRETAPVHAVPQPSAQWACHDPSVKSEASPSHRPSQPTPKAHP
ncbi:MFS transporter [Desertimonas flava]|uniref:MFS transporter n=1 Tax=Desertimonas flava TaxID=2064846 RepID=UPI000E343B7B|nr:MFS transporter [Desertimonas flava]